METKKIVLVNKKPGAPSLLDRLCNPFTFNIKVKVNHSQSKSEDDFGHSLLIAKHTEILEGSIFRLIGLLIFVGWPDGHRVEAGTCELAPKLL